MSGRGEVLAGRYRLEEELGRGGMGTVWRAYDTELRRDVAVKELTLPRDSSPGRRVAAVRRAMREARAAARLDHPGIVTVHDVVESAGHPWIVMEMLTGRSLDKVVTREGPLEPRRAAAIGVEVLDALRHAYTRGVLHRDVKPANIFLRDDGRAVLTDFGIAALAGDAPLTRPGALIGSPSYMAPERVRGEPAGPESDLWSLGVTLYVLVEQYLPFAGETPMGVLGAVLADEPAPFRRAGPLAPVLLALLTKDPAARPDAESTQRFLQRVADGEQAPTPPSGEQAPTPPSGGFAGPGRGIAGPWPTRHRLAAALAVAVAVVLLIAIGVIVLDFPRDGRPAPGARPSTRAAGGPTPINELPGSCGLISREQLEPYVPVAASQTYTGDAMGPFGDYFSPTEGCEWQENSGSPHYLVRIISRVVRDRPPLDVIATAHEDFATLRRDIEAGAHASARAVRAVPGAGDEAFAYDTGDTGDVFYTDLVARSSNLLVKVQYMRTGPGRTTDADRRRVREGTARIAQLMIDSYRAGRPLSTS
ncbi:protein kinase domain-containing protein [Actinomadura sp. HBU206391]|uniref:protein kinase domain-containing protein n=1 Tax=Actinomadura sp. HBU206391 TaxID=2731692 RepID=UPI0016505201|nr:serine/threonine-protein kinase [Actinomadura sp. HBU206391]MBC6456633.1 serine/threonine protein kinase [Actinomadura sp. HBU206391]